MVRLLQAADSAHIVDSVKVQSPLPGGIATVVRFLFNLPQWFQIAGAVLGVLVAAAIVVRAWRHRQAIRDWYLARSPQIRFGIIGTIAGVVLATAVGGAVGWHYMQHNNGFCTGCHVMESAYGRFTVSEHDSLECHSCHQQSIFASTRQLYLWVAERPQGIGMHSKLPNRICEQCHVNGEGKGKRQRIMETAGHRAHFESDSSVLKNLQCVTCHGVEVHHFGPVDSTCGQANCHANKTIALGKMARQTSLHCTTCHQFTALVPKFVSRDSASGTLVPGNKQCLDCHAMRQVLASFDPSRDPHNGTCGMCHNPHVQKVPADAAKTCATARCHADWRKVPFHVGSSHRLATVETSCTLCHVPHAARVDPSDCAGCHAAVKQREAGRGRRLPLPFDTTKALRTSMRAPRDLPEGPVMEKGGGPFFPGPPAGGDPLGGEVTPPDSFPHDRHKALACITCHVSKKEHGRLTFEQPRGCQICHHQAPSQTDCAKCHASAVLSTPESALVQVAVRGAPPRSREVPFDHARHHEAKCVSCHSTPVTLAPSDSASHCVSCHESHHTADRQCSGCHANLGAEMTAAHKPPIEAHQACDVCHRPAVVGQLVPDRSFCLTCHQPQANHFRDRECSVCHLLQQARAPS